MVQSLALVPSPVCHQEPGTTPGNIASIGSWRHLMQRATVGQLFAQEGGVQEKKETFLPGVYFGVGAFVSRTKVRQ